jgi:hypothetical protein
MLKRLLISIGGIILFLVAIYLLNYIKGTPEFFPLHNPKGKYKIVDHCLGESDYCVEYRGDGVIKLSENASPRFYQIIVGTARQDLKPFVNKEIIITSGRFNTAYNQCIQNKCTPLGGPFIGIDLYSIKIK